MPKRFDDLLDEITEVRRNAAASSDTRLGPRVSRLEHIVQRLLLALAERAVPEEDAEAVSEDDRIVEIIRKPQ
jgi:hypothetical protein